MSRSGYSDSIDNWQMIKWRGMVASAIRGKRGQQFLRDLIAALDAMPEKCLIAEELQTAEGVCAIGSVGVNKRIDMSELDPEEPEGIAATFDIATCLAQEIMYENDEGEWRHGETPEQRWTRMRAWAAKRLRPEGEITND